jgi:acetolactate synthase-1/2/3 large subunit
MAQIRKAVALLKASKRPIVYAGGGVINAGPEASRLLGEFVRMTGFPCTNTLMGLGAYPSSDPQFLGMLGMHGHLRGEPRHAWLRRHAEHRARASMTG